MSYLIAFLGIIALILLHEAGHFAVAKAVGMRVERFCLFIGPMIWGVKRGETEYGIAPIPLGGYVKISGMSPREELPPEVVPRAYYNQPVWKRIAVIVAGPAVNLVLAFVIVFGVILDQGESVPTARVAAVQSGTPAASTLRPGDTLVAVDGVGGSPDRLRGQLATHRCPGPQVNGCAAATPARLTVRRDGRLETFSVTPRYSDTDHRPLVGFAFGSGSKPVGPAKAASLTTTGLWDVTKATVSAFARIFEPQERKQLHSVVGIYTYAQQSFATDTTRALQLLALISLSLGIINLFPFLPLDGGHVFWALAEKVRGRRIPFEVMERAGVVGAMLILLIFAIGLSNDISALSGSGLGVR
jgi:regulator of sigma E protease